MSNVSLAVNGRIYAGWKTARVMRSIESVSGSFELSVSERWENQDQPWPIGEGDTCVVSLGNTPIITGYIDRRSLSYNTSSHDVSVTGRDRAGDLVDCSALVDFNGRKANWEFKGISVLQFAQKICKPFGINVSLQPGLKLPTNPVKLCIDPGDSAFNALEHACRLAGVLPVSDGQGGLVLTRAGKERCTSRLVQGENILSASAEFDHSQRFHQVFVLAQHRGTDEFSGKSAAAISGKAFDIDISRTERVLIVRPEGGANQAHAQLRAEWETITRAARGDSVTVTVQGWEQSDGTPWPINKLVSITSPLIGVDGDMLITQATYNLTVDGGSTTQLQLKRPDAFLPQPTTAPTSGDRYWKEIVKGV